MNRCVVKEGLNQGMLARLMEGGAAIETSTMAEPLLLGEEQVHIVAMEDQGAVLEPTESNQPKVTTVVDENNNEIV